MTVKIYTKTGDQGMTGLLGKGRVPKDDVRIEAYGTVDELNAVLGLAGARARPGGRRTGRAAPGGAVRRRLGPGRPFARGSVSPRHQQPSISPVSRPTIDALETELKPLTQFILPGGTLAAAHIHLARTVCRRAERLTVRLSRAPGENVSNSLVIYLNRLSDLLFVLARVVNHRAGVADTPWKGM